MHLNKKARIALLIVLAVIFAGRFNLLLTSTALTAALALRYLSGAYVRGMDMSKLMYAGVCVGLVPMLYAPAVYVLPLAVIAVMMFGFSLREILVLFAGILLGPLAICYLTWFFGGEFVAPVDMFVDALTCQSGYTLGGSDSVVALAAVGVYSFVMLCSAAMFLADKHSVGVKPRGILMFNIVSFVLACAAFLLPSATVGLFAFAALPAAVIMPIMFLRMRETLSLALYSLIVLVFFLHLFVQ